MVGPIQKKYFSILKREISHARFVLNFYLYLYFCCEAVKISITRSTLSWSTLMLNAFRILLKKQQRICQHDGYRTRPRERRRKIFECAPIMFRLEHQTSSIKMQAKLLWGSISVKHEFKIHLSYTTCGRVRKNRDRCKTIVGSNSSRFHCCHKEIVNIQKAEAFQMALKVLNDFIGLIWLVLILSVFCPVSKSSLSMSVLTLWLQNVQMHWRNQLLLRQYTLQPNEHMIRREL